MSHDPAVREHLVCLSGPDQGKRISLGPEEVVIGRSPESALLSADPDVGERHVALRLTDGAIRFRVMPDARVFVDAREQAEGVLAPGQQLRVGGSYWSAARQSGSGVSDLLDSVGRGVRNLTGTDELQDFSVQEFFSDISKRRTEAEIEEFFIVGTRRTTPQLSEVDSRWPKPWLFMKSLSLSLLVYAGFAFAFHSFHNANLIPGLIMIGALVVPVSVVFFFFEMNVLRNVSVYQVIKALIGGGLLSLITSLYGFQLLQLGWLGASSAGIIEEAGKLVALLILCRHMQRRWLLNGLLLGSAVGAGFAVFESAGYALRILIPHGADAMFENIWLRGVLSPGGHVVWTAMVGAALWRVGGNPGQWAAGLQDVRFLRVIALVVGLHMLWNSPLDLPFFAKQIALTLLAWMAVLGFVQSGLKQVREAQAAEPAAELPA